jgi:ribosomal 50S subunit-recycling heat shock protein
MSGEARQRVDVWLYRARFVKTRAAASRLVSEGGVRLMRDGIGRRLEKPSSDLTAGDSLIFRLRENLLAVRVEELPSRRGPAAEARRCYSELDADSLA